MLRRQPRRAGVEVEALGESADLVRTAGLDDSVAATHAPHPPADPVARLEHGDVPAGAPELVGRYEPGNAAAEDHDLAPATGAGRQPERLRRRRRRVEQTHRLHAEIDRRIAADGAEPLEKAPPGQRHYLVSSGTAAVTSISTSQPGSTRPATCIVERAGRFGCAEVPKNSR